MKPPLVFEPLTVSMSDDSPQFVLLQSDLIHLESFWCWILLGESTWRGLGIYQFNNSSNGNHYGYFANGLICKFGEFDTISLSLLWSS